MKNCSQSPAKLRESILNIVDHYQVGIAAHPLCTSSHNFFVALRRTSTQNATKISPVDILGTKLCVDYILPINLWFVCVLPSRIINMSHLYSRNLCKVFSSLYCTLVNPLSWYVFIRKIASYWTYILNLMPDLYFRHSGIAQ